MVFLERKKKKKETKSERRGAGAAKALQLFRRRRPRPPLLSLSFFSSSFFFFFPASAPLSPFARISKKSNISFRFFLLRELFYKWLVSLFVLKISIVFGCRAGKRERERERESDSLSFSFSSTSLPFPSFSLPFPPTPQKPHHTSHRGSRLSLASSHLVTILPNAVFFSGASSASTCAIGECEGSRRDDQPSRTRVVTSTAQMWPLRVVSVMEEGKEGEKRGKMSAFFLFFFPLVFFPDPRRKQKMKKMKKKLFSPARTPCAA